MITRIGGKDIVGPGPVWHGPDEAEVYQGKLWGFRGVGDPLADGKIYFDSIDGTAWNGGGVRYEAKATYWRQLRRRGSQLFFFGFNAGAREDGSTDTPICAASDGRQIRRAEFPFFSKRMTRCLNALGNETLIVTGNDTDTGRAVFNGGRALAVVELVSTQDGNGPGEPPLERRVCLFWVAEAAEFRMVQSDFVAAGGDLGKLPLYLSWTAAPGYNGGGYWKAASTLPTTPYLQLNLSGGLLVRYQLHGPSPYDPDMWALLCFIIHSDGSVGVGPFEPQPKCDDAACALDKMPVGTKWRVIGREVPFSAQPLSGLQMTDLEAAKTLSLERDTYPMLWARFDSTAPIDDLTTYTRLLKLGRVELTPKEVTSKVEVVVLVTPSRQPCALPALGRRFS